MSNSALDVPPYPDFVEDLLNKICEELQLSEARYEQARERYRLIGEWLGEPGSRLAAHDPDIYSQGSFRIGTTVHLKGTDVFDLDAVCELKIDWKKVDPIAVLNAVQLRLAESPAYRPLIERKNRCVRLVYKDAFHVDILPAARDHNAGTTCVRVPDRQLHEWVPSNPIGYARWFETRTIASPTIERFAAPLPAQEPAADKPVLKRSVQLLKRWRDVRWEADRDAAPISIVLTTLAGLRYAGQRSVAETLFGVVEGVRMSIPESARLKVCNPANVAEDLTERWDAQPEAYLSFVEGVTDLHDQLRRLSVARGIPAIKAIFKGLFGERLTDKVISAHADELQRTRTRGGLSIVASAGALTATGGKGTVPVRSNTFHG